MQRCCLVFRCFYIDEPSDFSMVFEDDFFVDCGPSAA